MVWIDSAVGDFYHCADMHLDQCFENKKGVIMKMEQGILFSKADKTTREYRKSFCFAETPKSAFWDRNEQTERPGGKVTREEAMSYDAIMEEIILAQFF